MNMAREQTGICPKGRPRHLWQHDGGNSASSRASDGPWWAESSGGIEQARRVLGFSPIVIDEMTGTHASAQYEGLHNAD